MAYYFLSDISISKIIKNVTGYFCCLQVPSPNISHTPAFPNPMEPVEAGPNISSTKKPSRSLSLCPVCHFCTFCSSFCACLSFRVRL